MTLTEKLDRLMQEKGINRRQLSQQSEIPYMTIVNFYEKGTDNVKLSTLKKLANYFCVSLDYIADDSVEAASSFAHIELADEERSLIESFHTLNAEGRHELLNYSKYLVSSGKYVAESAEA